MDFAFSEEQEEFRKVLARFLGERWPVAEVRRLAESGTSFAPSVWKQLAGELGLLGLAIPEEQGGQGAGFLELGIALEELGRELAGGPYFASACLATHALLHCAGASAQREWLPQLAAGDVVATLAAGERPDRADPDGVTATCLPEGDGFRVSGSFSGVLSGMEADLLLVAARAPESRGAAGISLLAVRSDAPGLERTAAEPLDLTRPHAELRLDGAAATLLGTQGEAWPGLARTLDQAAIGLAAEMIGGAERCLDAAVEHAKQRIQFARPIGSFQAIKHKAAEVLLELESARVAAYWAGWVASRAESDPAELAEAASIAKSLAGDAYLRAARESIQIHGGIGFTWEADSHLYYRRAWASAILFGDPCAHRARLAASMDLARPRV